MPHPQYQLASSIAASICFSCAKITYTYIYRICHSSPCPSAALPGRDFWAGVMGREAASPLLTITVLEVTFSAAALPGDRSTPELHNTNNAISV